MFTTCDSWCDHEGKKFECHAALPPMFILLLRSVPLVFTKFTKPWSCQKTKFYFSMLLTTPWSWKKLFTLSLHKNCLHKKCINCYYIHYAAIMAKKYIFSFQQYYIHYALMLKKKTFSPIANCYYIHYIRIMSKKKNPYGLLRSLWSWQKYKFLFQHYVYYTLTMATNILFQYYNFNFSTTLSRF